MDSTLRSVNMKKFSITIFMLALSVSLVACGRRGNNEATMPSVTTPSTNITILPDPTIDTNIPDPDVDTSMPMYTESTSTNSATDSTDASGRSSDHKRNSMGTGSHP